MATNPNNSYSIKGIIYDQFNSPLNNVKVKAFDKDLRTEQLLGEASTDKNGTYLIKYTSAKFKRAEIKSADVFIRVFENIGRSRKELGASEVYFNVPREFELNFKVDGTANQGPPEYNALVAVINPLVGQSIKIHQLKENDKHQDISFLVGETGAAKEKLELLILAHQFATTTKLEPDLFYGLLRMNFPTKLNDLLLSARASLENGLKEAINQNIISKKWKEELEKYLNMLDQLAVNQVLPDEGHTDFKQLISKVITKPELQKTFVETYFENESKPDKFWEKLTNKRGFKDGKTINKIKYLFQLNLITDNVPALTSALWEDGEIEEIKDLARFSQVNWESRINKLVSLGKLKEFPVYVEGRTNKKKSKNYAASLTQSIHQLFPTEVFKHKLSKDTNGPFAGVKRDLTRFFAENPDFDLRTNRIKELLKKADFTGIRNKEKTAEELIHVNQLYKIHPYYDFVRALRNEGVDSALSLVKKYNKEQFTKKMKKVIDSETADILYKKAIICNQQVAGSSPITSSKNLEKSQQTD